MLNKWKLWLLAPLLVILAFGVFKSGAWQKSEAIQETPAQVVVTQQVAKVKLEKSLALTGDVQAGREAVINPEVAGKVLQVAVENGDAVTAGQTLIALENQTFAHTVAVNQATLQKAEAALSTAQANYRRFAELHKQGAVADKDFEDIQTALQVAEADVSSAKAALAMAQRALQDSTITSPINGLVADRQVNLGAMVSPQGDPLMTVQDISSVYVVVNIEQKDLASVRLGARAKVSVEAYGQQEFQGVVENINPVANQGARVFATKIKVANPEHLLKPGMFAKAQIKMGTAEDVVAVPQSALTSKQGMYFVFLPEGDRVKRQQVEIGQVIDQLVEIKSGLQENDQVVITNVNKLKDQDKVKISK